MDQSAVWLNVGPSEQCTISILLPLPSNIDTSAEILAAHDCGLQCLACTREPMEHFVLYGHKILLDRGWYIVYAEIQPNECVISSVNASDGLGPDSKPAKNW